MELLRTSDFSDKRTQQDNSRKSKQERKELKRLKRLFSGKTYMQLTADEKDDLIKALALLAGLITAEVE